MSSPTGIIPEELMLPRRLRDVMEFLRRLPVPGHDKRALLQGWARTVGVKLSASQFRAVESTGSDR